MKKIGTITFHASHNYGSSLQAYALQEYVKKLCKNNIEYKIINLRTKVQKEIYTNVFEQKNWKSYIKRLFVIKEKEQLSIKCYNFENFIHNKLDITKEFSTLEELKKQNLGFDYYISGSDQIWNLTPVDFDWSYYLEFIHNAKKISYSASFGPIKQNWTSEHKERIKNNLNEYNHISVRELGSLNNIKDLINKEAKIHIDPTLLLTEKEWDKIIDKEPILKKDYILFYDLKWKKTSTKIAKVLSKKFKMPVIITCFTGIKAQYSNFEKHYDCGPLEFLNLIKNAKLVLSSSFHGTVFSIIFHKHFFAIDGDKDFRINNLLTTLNLQNRTINIKDLKEKSNQAFDKINFSLTEDILNKERNRSKEYLLTALEIKIKEKK